ncbi:hypothetical protein [Planctomycetes bacterium CA13]
MKLTADGSVGRRPSLTFEQLRGVTIVLLDIRVFDNGEVYIRAKDPLYANPGPDEVQPFNGT